MSKKNFETTLTKVNNVYYPMIERQLTGNGIEMDDYAKQCVLNGLSAIHNTLDVNGVSWNDPHLDQSNITETLLNIASLKLNASANPREVYFQIRNVKFKRIENGKEVEVWKKQIEMGIEGDGNDAILARFGRDVKEVRQYWVVRENDEFHYPEYVGLEMTPPRWKPTGKGKVVRVVYPIIKTSGSVEYHIAEREDVIKNLVAHISNNLRNETFNIAKSRFDATAKQKQEIAKKKREILDKAVSLGLDGALNDEELQNYISPAWKDPQSRESMLIRKMRNNIVKKIPKDFGHAFVEMQYEDATSEVNRRIINEEIRENANSEFIDIEPESVTEVVGEPVAPKEAPKSEPKGNVPKQPEEPEKAKDEPKKAESEQVIDEFDGVPF